jgi:hypothetical protein
MDKQVRSRLFLRSEQTAARGGRQGPEAHARCSARRRRLAVQEPPHCVVVSARAEHMRMRAWTEILRLSTIRIVAVHAIRLACGNDFGREIGIGIAETRATPARARAGSSDIHCQQECPVTCPNETGSTVAKLGNWQASDIQITTCSQVCRLTLTDSKPRVWILTFDLFLAFRPREIGRVLTICQ